MGLTGRKARPTNNLSLAFLRDRGAFLLLEPAMWIIWTLLAMALVGLIGMAAAVMADMNMRDGDG